MACYGRRCHPRYKKSKRSPLKRRKYKQQKGGFFDWLQRAYAKKYYLGGRDL